MPILWSPSRLATRASFLSPAASSWTIYVASGRVPTAAYRNANIEACKELGSPLQENEIWPLPLHLAKLAHVEAVATPVVPGPPQPACYATGSVPNVADEGSLAPAAPLLSVFAKTALVKRSRTPLGTKVAGATSMAQSRFSSRLTAICRLTSLPRSI